MSLHSHPTSHVLWCLGVYLLFWIVHCNDGKKPDGMSRLIPCRQGLPLLWDLPVSIPSPFLMCQLLLEVPAGWKTPQCQKYSSLTTTIHFSLFVSRPLVLGGSSAHSLVGWIESWSRLEIIGLFNF